MKVNSVISAQDNRVSYIFLHALVKCLRVFAIYWIYDVAKGLNVFIFGALIACGAAAFYLGIQRPFTYGSRLSSRQAWNIFYIGAFRFLTLVLWITSLSICGPLRSTLLCEHSDAVILATISALFSSGTPSKTRGALCFVGAFISILLFDYDSIVSPSSAGSSTTAFSSESVANVFHSVLGLSDHKAGVVLLCVTMLMTAVCSHLERRIAVDVGGAKRLNALVSYAMVVVAVPCAVVAYFFAPSESSYTWTALLLPLLYIIIVGFVVFYYAEAVCVSRLQPMTAGRIGSLVSMVSAMAMTLLWNHPTASKITRLHGLDAANVIADEHALSAGVVFGFVLLSLGVLMLTSVTRASHWDLIGTTEKGLPIYREAQMQRSVFSVSSLARSALHRVLEAPDSRRIFYFLCLNLTFTFVELIYGAWTNSLGLLSDGFHMFFDCAALVFGLVASVVAHWRPTKQFTFGYDRIEILSGFVNGLFLVVIASAVLISAIDRLFDPPHINTHRLLFVSFGGLLINLFGVFAFHGAIFGGDSGDDHGHSHGGGHGHSHGGGGHHGHSHNTNMEGVFLHVLADTLGSVGVIVSSFLIERYGINVADPICSIFIAVLIIASVVPLLRETSHILLLRVPKDLQKSIGEGLQNLLTIEGVLSYRDQHFWRHSSGVVCGVLHVQVTPDALEPRVTSRVTALFAEIGITRMGVQVEKESYFSHMSGLGMSIDQPVALSAKAAGYDMALEMIKTY